ncbi:hypothetical protein K0J45_16605 [Shewanella alkalitolerans]|uniref:hypothetical protein n=1 Tax=Shewanella alkalitolerans TaxID=2864209 RepID=UPI001C659C11|nr:hypothetical protein [Shewanella alkalitolerans]QYJ97112.1 hypothetical protein K0J45_16605 [Shewanella alkalitolerans]
MSNHNLAIILLTLPLLGGAMACEPNSDAEKAKNKPKVQQSAAQSSSQAVSDMVPANNDNKPADKPKGDRTVPNHRLPFEQQLDEQAEQRESGKEAQAQPGQESVPCQAEPTEQTNQSRSQAKSEKPGEPVKPGESTPECDKPRQE